jgi:hypothetical protein
MTEERAIYGCGGDPIDDDRADGLAPLPQPDLLVDCAQGFVEGWTASRVRAYAAQQVAAERERCARIVEQIEWLQRENEVLRAERDQARDRVDNAAKLLTSIHSCMYPGAVKMEDGRLMVFRPENPHEYLQALSDRIRALPDEMVARGVVDA